MTGSRKSVMQTGLHIQKAWAPDAIAVTVSRAAQLLSVSRTTIYALARADSTFPTIRKFGRASRILLADLQAWAEAQGGPKDTPSRSMRMKSIDRRRSPGAQR